MTLMANDTLAEEQRKDPNLRMIRNYLENDTEPLEAEQFIVSRAAKNYWTNKSIFILDNSVLYYHWEDGSESRWLYVFPRSLRSGMFKLAHDNPTSGHMGQEKTYLTNSPNGWRSNHYRNSLLNW